jgi:hypothetical protein
MALAGLFNDDNASTVCGSYFASQQHQHHHQRCRDPPSTGWSSSLRHVTNQWQLFLFLTIMTAVHVVLFATRAQEFTGMRNLDGSRPNGFYMVSRACGQFSLVTVEVLNCVDSFLKQ